MTIEEAKRVVKEKYPDAYVWGHTRLGFAIFYDATKTLTIRHGLTEEESWMDAASKILAEKEKEK